MVDIVVREHEECAPDSSTLWDSVWDAERGLADWQLSGADEPLNRGGLRSKAALATAVTLALFTDKRIDPSHPLYYLADGDPRGYWGDAIDVRDDLFETPLGSHLWLLERAPLTIRGVPATQWARQFALEALEPLIRQGLVVRIEVEATAQHARGRLDLVVRLFGRDGLNVFDRKFDLIWNQVTGNVRNSVA